MIENIVKKPYNKEFRDTITQNKFSYIVMPGLFAKRVLIMRVV